ncbi:uncharacterized protein LOC110723820 [Chenopodium quinoa]|uniref:uncharacterized protein LOC110723820 n=1 Tax=Chenopodium quinoa TaxID=63459 RepID=UPI000B7732E9|nr:uncharacterized protein LOC110723820 [Chenopodium quinoa]
MKRRERSWMYDRLDGYSIKPEFLKGVEEFMQYCKDHPESSNPNEVRCPCVKCKNLRLHPPDMVRIHLYGKGFVPNYYEWMCQGEGFPTTSKEKSNEFREMVVDALGDHNQDQLGTEASKEDPNTPLEQHLDLVKASEQPLYEGSSMPILPPYQRTKRVRIKESKDMTVSEE